MKNFATVITTLYMLSCSIGFAQDTGIIFPGAELEKLADGFAFTEGVASDAKGNIYFSDIPASRIHFYTISDNGKIFIENSNRANGLYVDHAANIIACEGVEGGRLVQITPQGTLTVIADGYEGNSFNSPNDLWKNPNGGYYITDPRYGRSRDNLPQGGEHVYYVSPNWEKVIRVIDEMVRPNGITGSEDGSTLYVADHGAGKTFKYAIQEEGKLTQKELFADEGSDGMTIDSEGNVYLTNKAVRVYNPAGELIETIQIPEGPTNVCFGGEDYRTLYISAPTTVYKLKMKVSKVFSN